MSAPKAYCVPAADLEWIDSVRLGMIEEIGREAYDRGDFRDANPYDDQSDRAAWDLGWRFGQFRATQSPEVGR